MKKLILILMILSMFLSLMIPSIAEEKPIIDIFKEENQVVPDKLIYDKSYYYGELKDYDLTDAFFFKAYTVSYPLYDETLYPQLLADTYTIYQYYAWVVPCFN